VGILAKIRRMHLREHLPIREIARKTGLARNTIRQWLRQPEVIEPDYAKRDVITKLDAFAETLSGWLKTNQHRNKRERRTVLAMYQELAAIGYRGGYGRVAAFARRFHAEAALRGSGRAFIPLKFQMGDAFQFDWSTEYVFVGGLRCRLRWHTPSSAPAAPSGSSPIRAKAMRCCSMPMRARLLPSAVCPREASMTT
jgi:transposase-like protein